MAEKHFVKIGAKNLQFAKLNDEGFVDGDVIALPGTTEVKIAIGSDTSSLTADDGPYMSLSSGINKITATINNYFLTPEVKRLLFGTNYALGMEMYGTDTVPNKVAMMYETQLISNENKPLYIGLLKGVFKFPDSQTKSMGNGAPDPNPDEIEGEFVMKDIGDTKKALINGFSSDPNFNIENFKKLVFPKSADEINTAWTAFKAEIDKQNKAVTKTVQSGTPTVSSDTH